MKCWYDSVCKEASDNCDVDCIRYKEMRYLVDNSGIPINKQIPEKLYPGDDYDAFCRLNEVKLDILSFVNSGSNIYITSGNTGNGKTSWAIKLLLKFFDEVWAGNGFRTRGLFVYVPQLLLKLKDFNNPLSDDYKQNLLNCDVVVWDDIGSTELSNYDLSQLLLYIDQRTMAGKANIYTGNLNTKDRLAKVLGERLVSRVWNSSEVVQFTGKDRR